MEQHTLTSWDYPAAMEYLAGLGRFGWHLGLERIQALLAELGHPEQGGLYVHVAGTNGKGSVSAYVAHILRAAGYKVGLYTSPHLVDYPERFACLIPDGQPGGGPEPRYISREELAALLQKVARAARRVESRTPYGHPTEFEVLTAAAFLYFRDRCQWTVLEVGLGGRLDATNVILPRMCVITHLALDHTDRLGPTLAHIAREKAGILKPGVLCVVAPQGEVAADSQPEGPGGPRNGEAWQIWPVLLEHSGQVQAPLVPVLAGGAGAQDAAGAVLPDGVLARSWRIVAPSWDQAGGSFSLQGAAPGTPEPAPGDAASGGAAASTAPARPAGPEERSPRLHTPLLGPHQVHNAAAAAVAARLLLAGPRLAPPAPGFSPVRRPGLSLEQRPWPWPAIAQGLAETSWPGRLEVLSRQPFILLDGAHNPDGVRRLVQTVESLYPGQRFLVVGGVLRDRPYAEMLGRLARVTARALTVAPASPRAVPAEEAAQVFQRLGVAARPVSSIENAVEEALRQALRAHEAQRPLPILTCGSLYLVGLARQAFLQRLRMPR